MRHADSFHPEGADLDESVLRDELAQLGRAQQAVLVQLGRDQLERELRGPHLGHAHLAQEVRQPADVVFVPVREHDGAHPVGAVLEVAEVRQHEVDAEMLVAREGQACVDDDDVLVQLEDGHVLADLTEPAEGNDAKSRHKESLRGFGGMYFAEPSHAGAAASRPARSRHSLTRSRSPGVASTNGRRKPPTS